MNFSNSSKQPRVRLMLLTITYLPQAHQFAYLQDIFRDEVMKQLQSMLDQGIIKQSNSPWMAPTVFIPKKSGEIRLCVDYRALNKKTSRDAYPLPLPDAVQDHLAGSTIFTTLDLRCGYWQVPVWPGDQERQLSVQDQVWGYTSFVAFLLGCWGHQGPFRDLWIRSFRAYHLMLYI